MDFAEGSFANAEHERTLFLKANVSGALNKLGGNAVGDAGKRSHAAWKHNHGVGGIGTAGDVRGDVGVGLLMNFRRGLAGDLRDQIAAAADAKFLGHDAQSAVRGDEVDGFNALIGCHSEQQMFEKYRPARASRGDGQVARSMNWQAISREALKHGA